MKILKEKKLKNNDVLWDCEFDDSEVKALINYAVNRILENFIDGFKNKKNIARDSDD